MKYLLTFLLAALTFIPLTAQEDENTTVYFLIRHAEKDRSNPNEKNPNLTQDGMARALKWAEVLSTIKLDAVYSTNYNRTKQTAKPTAIKQGLEVVLYNPRTLNIDDFKASTKGKKVLIVGHSNTTPAMVNKLIGKEKYEQIDDRNNANLYIVTIKNNTVTDLVLKID